MIPGRSAQHTFMAVSHRACDRTTQYPGKWTLALLAVRLGLRESIDHAAIGLSDMEPQDAEEER